MSIGSNYKLTFGKNKGLTLQAIKKNDSKYYRWLSTLTNKAELAKNIALFKEESSNTYSKKYESNTEKKSNSSSKTTFMSKLLIKEIIWEQEFYFVTYIYALHIYKIMLYCILRIGSACKRDVSGTYSVPV